MAMNRPIRWAPARVNSPELLDGPIDDLSELRQNLADIRRANRWLGGTSLTLKALARFVQDGQSVTVLDVATGTADIPVALHQWARRRRMEVSVTAIDLSPVITREAMVFASHVTRTSFAVADGRALPFADDSFDIAACSLVLHHLTEDDAVLFLREMRRVARRGVVVNDLIRSWPALIGAWVWSRLFSTNRLTRHDAPISIRRAFTETELVELCHRAGVQVVATSSWFASRVVVAGVKAAQSNVKSARARE
jgi:ubiquinone/menaquinone biosynthesis C-methylase UbiE